MGVFDKIKNAFGVDDEDYDDDFEYEEEEEVVENTFKPDFSQNKKEKNVSFSTAAPVSSTAAAGSPLQVVLVKPEKFDDASGIADSLNAKKTVVLNLEATSKEVSRRLVDFLSGVAYANNGQIKKIANSTFIITPYNVDVSGIGLLEEIDTTSIY
ncbi:MAG: cell division protein SepF [Ruminococcaceae bacterium]|nr:cell division protein SepF [Oscillospiraceae bacterium]